MRGAKARRDSRRRDTRAAKVGVYKYIDELATLMNSCVYICTLYSIVIGMLPSMSRPISIRLKYFDQIRVCVCVYVEFNEVSERSLLCIKTEHVHMRLYQDFH